MNWQELLRGIILTILEARDDCSTVVSVYKSFFDHLKTASIQSPSMRTAMLRAVATPELAPVLTKILEDDERRLVIHNPALVEVETSLISCFLNIAFQTPETSCGFPSALAIRFVERQSGFASTRYKAARHLVPRSKPISTLDHPSSQETPNLGNHWREGLAAELSRQAKTTYDASVRLMARACEELEARCESVEEPLRAEQTKNEQLKRDFEDLQARAGTREEEAQGLCIEVAALREQNAQADASIAAAAANADEDMRRIDRLEKQSKQREEDVSRELGEIRKEHERRELDLQTSIACHVEKMDGQNDKIRSLEQVVHDEARTLQMEQQEARDREQSLSASLSRLEDTIRSEQANSRRELEKSSRLEMQNSGLQERVKQLVSELDDSSAHCRELELGNEDLARNYKQKVQDMQDKHKQESLEAQQMALADCNELKQTIRDLEDNLEAAKRAYAEATELKDNDIRELRRKVQKISKTCQQKDVELAEAQTVRSRLLQTLGMDNQIPPDASGAARSGKAATIPSAKQLGQAFPDEVWHHDGQLDDDSESEHEPQSSTGSAASSSKSGPTPKRPKPRKPSAFKVPAIRQPSLATAEQKDKRATAGRQPHGPLPLQERSPNKRPAKVGRRSDCHFLTARHAIRSSSGAMEGVPRPGSTASKAGVDELATHHNEVDDNDDVDLGSFPDLSFEDLRRQDLEGTTMEL